MNLKRWCIRRLIRAMMLAHNLLLILAGWFGRSPRPQPDPKGWTILLTGTFHSDNWIKSHVVPLAQSKACDTLWMVASSPVPDLPKVKAIYPPRWLVRGLGPVAARLVVFYLAGLRLRPDIVGGFALIANGLVAALLARVIGAYSLYFCVGGPREIIDGGVGTETGPFSRIGHPDPVLERRLLKAVESIDLVVTMGTRAVEYFHGKNIHTNFHVVAGGIDAREFQPATRPPAYDLILVARLAGIKRIDTFLRTVRQVKIHIPAVKALVVGDGRLRTNLEDLARRLGLESAVTFLGSTPRVSEWLRQARLFVLTSESEGLSLALMEAMMSGLPAVVSDVGDLPDLVKNGVNGFLVDPRSPEQFAGRIIDLLSDENRRQTFARAARRSALRYETRSAIQLWEKILLPPPSGPF